MTITSAALMAARSSTATGDLSDAGRGKTLQLRATVLMVGVTVTKQTVGVPAATGPTGLASTTPGGALLRGTRSTNTSTFVRNRGLRRPVRDSKAGSRSEPIPLNHHAAVMDVPGTTVRAPVDTLSRCLLAGSKSITDAPAHPVILPPAADPPGRTALPAQAEAVDGFRPPQAVDVGGDRPGGGAS
ncbi:hypothetical protein [Corynebacterium parakroppenstedtii]|uniref:hypothetical protein n=1 Tax=Corynebacterium parakroppenstedtii TaxID=2828363 RepID=UPI0030EBF1DB